MKTLSNVRLRRKAARELLRDAQLPGLADRSRAVLAFNALRLGTDAKLDETEARLLLAEWLGSDWHAVQANLIASAKEMLKSK